MALLNKYEPSIHTLYFFDELIKEFNGNKRRASNYLGISRSTLYNWMERAKANAAPLDKLLLLISFENFKEYLRKNPNVNRNGYLLNEITRDRKPLRSNTLLIVEGLRNMVKEFNHA